MRLAAVPGVVLAAAASIALAGDEPLAPEAVKPLTQIAKDLARAGRAAELEEVLEALQAAGLEAKEAGRLAAACRADAAKVKKPAATLPAVAKSLKQLADTLAARIDKADEPARSGLARLVLRLDGQDAAAQRALGREKVGSEWLDAKEKERRTRRAEIGAALAKSRTLEVPIEVGRSDNPIFGPARPGGASFARCRSVTLHGVWPAEKLERILRDVLRALALDNFLVTGELALPELPSSELVFFDSRDDYARAIRLGLEKKWIARDQELDPEKCVIVYVGKELMGLQVIESAVAADVLLELIWFTPWRGTAGFRLGEGLQPGILAGLVNWTCLECFGARMGLYLVEVTKEGGADAGTTSSLSAEEKRIRERYRILADAGISGGRAWMRYLAARREDPPTASVLVDQIGRLQGDELLKATLVVEKFCEEGRLFPLLTKLPKSASGKPPAQAFEAACGQPLPDFDAAWREWLLPPQPGLVERLGETTKGDEALSPSERQVVDALNDLRHKAGAGSVPVELDRESSDACRTHALYLAKNPEQLARWPDAHEEYSDRPGFEPAGAWAGTHAVIAPGVKDGRAALDEWMATYYHRLPLLEGGLVRIGFALDHGTAVLDCASFVRPHRFSFVADADRHEQWSIVWPASGATGVPTNFSAELPHPVPGEDETKMGYPVTLQLQKRFTEARPEIELTLHVGPANGNPVACWFSTPSKPTNPQLAPDAAWCLIPKAPLQSGAQYTVNAKASWSVDPKKEVAFSWSFRCGR